MRSWLMLATLLTVIGLQSGCGDGMVETRRERQARQSRILDTDMRQLTDDWDKFWLNDHALRATRWSVE